MTDEDFDNLKRRVTNLEGLVQGLCAAVDGYGQQIGDIHAVNMSFGEIIKALAELPQDEARKKSADYHKLLRKYRRLTLPAYDENRPPGGPIPKDD